MYKSAMKNHEMSSFAVKWLELEDIILSEGGKAQMRTIGSPLHVGAKVTEGKKCPSIPNAIDENAIFYQALF